MQAQPAPRGSSLLRQFLLFLLLLILLAVLYCNNVAWFHQTGAQVREAVVAVLRKACGAFNLNPWHDDGDAVAFHPPLERVARAPVDRGIDAAALPPGMTPMPAPMPEGGPMNAEPMPPGLPGPAYGAPMQDAPHMPPMQQVPPMAMRMPPTAMPMPPMADVDGLDEARIAFARGDMRAAVEAYRGFLALNPDSIAGHGELGNVYYSVGMLPAAARAYFDAAARALDQGQARIAEQLLPAIGQGNPMLADMLEERLGEARGEAPGAREVMPRGYGMPPGMR